MTLQLNNNDSLLQSKYIMLLENNRFSFFSFLAIIR